jgi:hypothetical protein
MYSVVGITVDCVDPDVVAGFWRRALSLDAVNTPARDRRCLEVPLVGCSLWLTFRRVGTGKLIRNRVRLTLTTPNLIVGTARLLALGAIRLDNPADAVDHATLADVEGNEFDLFERPPTASGYRA